VSPDSLPDKAGNCWKLLHGLFPAYVGKASQRPF